ncbi:unnamed protein product, partial [marine sediment metagenome]
AMNDIPQGYVYPNEVHFEINQNNILEYKLASDFLNFNRVDVVCVQHEYGIFGGKNGIYLLELLRNLRTPVVTTLHTVLEKPTQGQKKVLYELGHISLVMHLMNPMDVFEIS